jgi:hypothetical protein
MTTIELRAIWGKSSVYGAFKSAFLVTFAISVPLDLGAPGTAPGRIAAVLTAATRALEPSFPGSKVPIDPDSSRDLSDIWRQDRTDERWAKVNQTNPRGGFAKVDQSIPPGPTNARGG